MTIPKVVRFDVGVPSIIDEVITKDCYGLAGLDPFPQWITDGGACFGAFSLACWSMGADHIFAYEPDRAAFDMLKANVDYNRAGDSIQFAHFALGWRNGRRHFCPCSTGKSSFGPHEGYDVDVCMIPKATSRGTTLLKLDVEGAERELFASGSLQRVTTYTHIVMEWHNYDGGLYAALLEKCDYRITKLAGGDGTAWDPTLAGGILTAQRRQ